jgi:type II secretory pathway pseudopilin PulG
MTMRTRRKQRGYTAVEVLSAMTLLAIGGAGVIGMQRVTIKGSEDARRFDVAGNIANEWTSRLQRDSAFWTQPNAEQPELINIASTRWLSLIGGCFPTWCNPPAATLPQNLPAMPEAGLTGSFDTFGRDLPAAAADATYCAQYRLEWIASPGVPPNLRQTGLMRVEVRVVWKHFDLGQIGNCTTLNDADDPDSHTRYHFVYATTAIRENPTR